MFTRLIRWSKVMPQSQCQMPNCLKATLLLSRSPWQDIFTTQMAVPKLYHDTCLNSCDFSTIWFSNFLLIEFTFLTISILVDIGNVVMGTDVMATVVMEVAVKAMVVVGAGTAVVAVEAETVWSLKWTNDQYLCHKSDTLSHWLVLKTF